MTIGFFIGVIGYPYLVAMGGSGRMRWRRWRFYKVREEMVRRKAKVVLEEI